MLDITKIIYLDEGLSKCKWSGFQSSYWIVEKWSSLSFKALFNLCEQWRPEGRGRPPRIRNYHEILGLILCFYCDRVYHKTLCVTFAVTPSVISRPLLIGEKILSDCLKTIKEAKIRWPIFEEQRHWAIKVQERYPLVKHLNGELVQLKLYLEDWKCHYRIIKIAEEFVYQIFFVYITFRS